MHLYEMQHEEIKLKAQNRLNTCSLKKNDDGLSRHDKQNYYRVA